MVARMLTFHVPDDDQLLAALGTVTLRHEHLNHILKMTIKSLTNLTPQEAIDATAYNGSRQLRERIRKLARRRLGDGEPLLKLSALITRAERLTNERNRLTHGLWAKELDGEAGLLDAPGELQPLPSLDDLRSLAANLAMLTAEINTARLEGFLKQALEESQDAV